MQQTTIEMQAKGLDYQALNASLRALGAAQVAVHGVMGQRYLGCGMQDQCLKLYGTPGNGLGQYLSGGTIEVFGSAQEATGDTMNAGEIIVHGRCGDAAGYGMRGGRILIRDEVGYRAGIHMKAYREHMPVMVVGRSAGSFLGEYLAGGLILVLGIGLDGHYPAGFFCGTGMHGGKIILRCDEAPQGLPEQVLVRGLSEADREEMRPHVEAYCRAFGGDAAGLLAKRYFVLTPNPEKGYHRLYTSVL